MIDAEELADALRAALPPDLQPHAAALAAALETAGRGQGAGDADPALQPLLRALAGRQIASGQSLISFGDGGQFGDVAIGDVAGGDLTRVSLNIAPGGAGDVVVGTVGAGARGVAVGKNIIQIGALVVPLWAVLGLAGALLLAAAAAYLSLRGPATMAGSGTFNIAVADFARLDGDTPRPDGAARQLSTLMYRALIQQQDVYRQANPADVIAIWNDSMGWAEKSATIGIVAGDSRAAREEAARERLAQLGADVLLYGYLRADGMVELNFYVAPQLEREAAPSSIAGSYQLGDPIRPDGLNLTTRAGAVFWLFKGLQYDGRGLPRRSLDVLAQGAAALPDWRERGEGKEILYFLQGQAALFMAVGAATPEEFARRMDEAAGFFERSAASNPEFLRAAIGRGGVALGRAQCSLGARPCPPMPAEDDARAAAFAAARADLDAATADYQRALELASRSPDQLYAQGVAPMSLGIAYLLRGELAYLQGEDASADGDYGLAVEAVELGLPPAIAAADPRLIAQGYLTLGTARWRRGRIAADAGRADEGLEHFRQARAAFAGCIALAEATADAVLSDEVLPLCAERDGAAQNAAQALGQ